MRHAVIMAGGSGTRLWPLSRAGRPKQLLDVVTERRHPVCREPTSAGSSCSAYEIW